MKRAVRLSIIFAVLAPALSARIRHIPSDYSTIQAGIDACLEGDTVLVNPGSYNERISFIGAHITVASQYLTTGDTSYISSTIIDGEQGGTVVTFHQYDDYTVALKGFTIRNGRANNGGGIYCVSSSSPIISNNIIRNNSAADTGSGGGIYCESYCNPTISNNTFISNRAGNGAGIACPEYTSATIRDNNFSSNVASGRGGGVYSHYAYPSIIDNSFTYNRAYQGGAIWAFNFDPIPVRSNIIYYNTVTGTGGGIYCDGNSAAIESNIISHNHANDGGGVFFSGSRHNITLLNNTINNNTAFQDGGGIYCFESYIVISGNTIEGNSAMNGGGIFGNNFRLTIIDNNIIGNIATTSGGGILLNTYGADVFRNIFTENSCAIRGGGIYSRGSLSAERNIFYGNAAKRGAAICCAWDVDTLINNTITANRVDTTGALAFLDNSNAYVSNTICWADTLRFNAEIYIDSTSEATIRYCDISGGYQGIGNINADPFFAGLPDLGLRWAGYPLDDSTKSPCIDTGDPASPNDSDGTRADMGAVPFDRREVNISDRFLVLPLNLIIIQNYPNPFNAKTSIKYSLPQSGEVAIAIYNIMGQNVAVLSNGIEQPGEHKAIWDAKEMPSGVYFARLQAGEKSETIKMVLLK